MVVGQTLLIALQVGLPYGPLTIAIFLAFVVLSFPDLTVEGSFALGAGMAAMMIQNGHGAWLGTLAAIGTGAVAGLITALLHTRLRVNPLLAGIITATAAWSVNLFVMPTGDIGLFGKWTLYNIFTDHGYGPQMAAIFIGGAACLLCGTAMVWFLRTEYGLSLRATGMNIQTARGLGIRTEGRQIIGLMLANGLAGFSGALVAQNDGFADVESQVGVLVVALAALMIGRSIIRSARLVPSVVAVLLGTILYQWVVAWALRLGLNPNYLNFATALIVVVAIVLRSHLRSLLSIPGTASAAKRRRERVQFFEDDRVTPII